VNPPAPTRTLSTAEDRREAVLEAAERVFPQRGLLATPTMEVAKAAGISQAYLFRLFPTKADLGIALVQRCNERIHRTFSEAAAKANAAGEDPIEAMGQAYVQLMQDRNLLLLQLHAHAASASMPEIREAMRTGFGRLVELVREQAGGDDERVQRFLSTGMLINVLLAMGADDSPAPWMEALMASAKDC
jgi:AcrR family transcriptional regulator